MFILNADLSYKSKDLLMILTTKIEKTERAKLRKEMLVKFKLEHHSVIGS
jgi:uncharacterized protein YnzC (UPF0291/DUF896 family)